MPWDQATFGAVSAGLRRSAAEGDFVPYEWNAGIQHNKDGGYSIYGCGLGQIAWFAAVFKGGAKYARQMLPVGSGQTEVNVVLKAVGLTRAEIKQLDPQALWSRFDYELEDAYRDRNDDPEHFIAMSGWLAEFFINELESVPVVPESTLSVSVPATRSSIKLKDFFPALFGKQSVPELV